MPNTREKLIELIETTVPREKVAAYGEVPVTVGQIADHLIANGVTVQEWIPASEPPKKNGYYLCVVCVSAVNQRKEYRRMILFWEDNVWIDMANCFRTKKPLYWMPMADVPQPPKGE